MTTKPPSPALARIRAAYLDGTLNDADAMAELLTASLGEIPRTMDAFARLIWAYRQLGRWQREKDQQTP